MVPEASLGAPLTVLPGKQTIKISRPGLPDETRELEVAGAQTKTLAIGAGPKAQSTTPGPTRPAEVGGGLGLVRILGIVVGGVGVVGLVTGTATGVMSNGKFATLEEECGGARCTDPKYADDVDSGKSRARGERDAHRGGRARSRVGSDDHLRRALGRGHDDGSGRARRVRGAHVPLLKGRFRQGVGRAAFHAGSAR